jgi:predicted lipase
MFKAWVSLQGDTYNAIKRLMAIYREVVSLVAYGHSLGGAIATLALIGIWDVFPEIRINTVYTQGKPRIGNELFANYVNYHNYIVRVVHWRDKVPHLPPQLLGYFH